MLLCTIGTELDSCFIPDLFLLPGYLDRSIIDDIIGIFWSIRYCVLSSITKQIAWITCNIFLSTMYLTVLITLIKWTITYCFYLSLYLRYNGYISYKWPWGRPLEYLLNLISESLLPLKCCFPVWFTEIGIFCLK